MIIVRLLSPGPWLVGTTKVYSGVGADIVMESITLTTAERRPWGVGRAISRGKLVWVLASKRTKKFPSAGEIVEMRTQLRLMRLNCVNVGWVGCRFVALDFQGSLCLLSFMMSGGTSVFFRRLLILLSSQKIRIRRIAITNSKNWTLISF